MKSMRRSALLLAIGLAAIASSGIASAKPVPISGIKSILWPRAGAPAGIPLAGLAGVAAPSPNDYNDLLFHGGVIEHVPSVYLIFWGTEWKTGFKTNDGNAKHTYTSVQAMGYITKFFANIGGSAWNGTQTQYCDNIPNLSTSCAGNKGARYITNPKNQLKGVWVDPSPISDPIITSGLAENLTNDPIATEAVKGSKHF